MYIKAGATLDLIKVAFCMYDFEMATSAKNHTSKACCGVDAFLPENSPHGLKFSLLWLAACLT